MSSLRKERRVVRVLNSLPQHARRVGRPTYTSHSIPQPFCRHRVQVIPQSSQQRDGGPQWIGSRDMTFKFGKVSRRIMGPLQRTNPSLNMALFLYGHNTNAPLDFCFPGYKELSLWAASRHMSVQVSLPGWEAARGQAWEKRWRRGGSRSFTKLW